MEEEDFPIQDIIAVGASGDEKAIYSKPSGTTYEVFIYDIGEFKEYEQLYLTLKNADHNDTVIIYFDSSGGDLTTAIAICAAIKQSKATVKGVIIGSCMSAATFIWLSCDEKVINKYTTFMIHAASNGYKATIHEMQNFTNFSRKMYEPLFRDFYSGFLSETELESVFNGATLWFMPNEVTERLMKRNDNVCNDMDKIIDIANLPPLTGWVIK